MSKNRVEDEQSFTNEQSFMNEKSLTRILFFSSPFFLSKIQPFVCCENNLFVDEFCWDFGRETNNNLNCLGMLSLYLF